MTRGQTDNGTMTSNGTARLKQLKKSNGVMGN